MKDFTFLPKKLSFFFRKSNFLFRKYNKRKQIKEDLQETIYIQGEKVVLFSDSLNTKDRRQRGHHGNQSGPMGNIIRNDRYDQDSWN